LIYVMAHAMIARPTLAEPVLVKRHSQELTDAG
jgi:hypothetical protein